MRLRWKRLFTGAIVAELVPILVLVALVAGFGPSEQALAEDYAARLGRWVGPVAGAVTCFVVGWWVARPDHSLGLQHGLALGALTAAIDLTLIVLSGAAFEWLFAASNAGRVLAGMLGGAAGARSRPAVG